MINLEFINKHFKKSGYMFKSIDALPNEIGWYPVIKVVETESNFASANYFNGKEWENKIKNSYWLEKHKFLNKTTAKDFVAKLCD